MRIVSIGNVKEGMELAKTVYSETGSILLKPNVILNNKLINSLKDKSIPAIYINDNISNNIEIEESIDQETRVKAISKIKDTFKSLELTNKKSNKKSNKTFLSSSTFNNLNDVMTNILENISTNNKATYFMAEVMSTNLSLYSHCVNVAILSITVARKMGMPEQYIKDLGIGALIHDIGMVQIDSNIIYKPNILSENERKIINQHPVKAYKMIKDDTSFSAITKMSVLMHHEKLDGTGYPLKVTKDKINRYVRVLTLCDMYDAMTSERVYRQSIPPYKALEILASECYTKLEFEVFKALKSSICIYPPGTTVRLSSGEKCIVIEESKGDPLRPQVKVLIESNGAISKKMKVIDLMKELTIFIEETCDM